MCDSNCESSSIGDGTCDDNCNVKACNFDGEDCRGDSGSSDSNLSRDPVIIIVAAVVGSIVLL
jgi:hypothetical protein